MNKFVTIICTIVLIIWVLILLVSGIFVYKTDEVLAQTCPPSYSETIDGSNIEEEVHVCPSPEVIVIEVPKEVIVEVPVYLEQPPAFLATSIERELLAELVYYEARGESFPGKCAVVSVVFNRLKYHGYNSIAEVITAENQFSPWKNGSMDGKLTPSQEKESYYEEIYRAVDFVIQHGVTIDEYVTFFRTQKYHTDTIEYEVIGNHFFSFKQKYYDMYAKGE